MTGNIIELQPSPAPESSDLGFIVGILLLCIAGFVAGWLLYDVVKGRPPQIV